MRRLVADFLAIRCSIFTESTQRTYRSQQSAYLSFCAAARATPVPASSELLALYAVFLSRRLQYSSITQYLNAVRVLHQEVGAANPLKDSYLLRSTLRGIRRVSAGRARSKLPFLPEHLLRLSQVCSFGVLEDLQFWTGTLLMFHGMLRISNVFPTGNSDHFARVQDFGTSSGGVILAVRSSKTRLRGSAPSVIFSSAPGHPLDLVQPLVRLFAVLSPSISLVASPFWPMSAARYSQLLKLKLVQCGIATEGLTAHSLRRGGATWALRCGVPADVIQLMGDWRSDCYKHYLSAGVGLRRKYSELMQCSLPSSL
jgi:hypothetical protein